LADLDDTVRSGGLGKIFDNPAPEVTPAVPEVHRFFRGVSVHTHRDANGVNYLLIYFNYILLQSLASNDKMPCIWIKLYQQQYDNIKHK